MKKILYIFLTILMLPLTSLLFVGCKENREIKDFYKTYTNIVDEAPNLSLVEATDIYESGENSIKIDINYSLSPKLSDLVDNNSTPYYQLKHFYQPLLDNTLSPLYFFGPAISSSKKVSEKQTEQLYSYLDKLKKDYLDINYYTGTLITSLKATDNESANLAYLKKLFAQYEKALNSAGNLSYHVCNVYFNTLLSNTNIDYSSKTYNQLTDSDLINISIATRTKLHYYKSIYANIYNQLYIRGGNLASLIIENPANIPEYEPYDEIITIKSITKKSAESLNNNKQLIYNNAISLHTIQDNIDLAYKHFTTATNKVVYLELNEHSSINEQNYGTIINQFATGIAQDSYEILRSLISLLYSY